MLYDYSTTTAASVRAVVDEAIASADATIAEIVAPNAPRSWAATMAPLDLINASMTEAYGRGPFMARVHPDKEVRDAATEAEEKITKWSSDLSFRRDLYEAVEEFAATDEAAGLGSEEARFLTFTRRDFRRAGHALTKEQRDEVQEIRTRLVELGVAFGRNIDEHQDGLDLTRRQLEGTDDSYIARLSPGEAEGTFRVSLDYPDYYPFMDEATNRDLRRQLQFKFYNKAVEQNLPLLEETIALRARMAEIFGLPSWAHYGMEEKMAKAPEVVEAFYADLIPPLEEKARDEIIDLRTTLGESRVEGWDYRYLHTAIRKERFGIDPTEVAGYFPLHRVLDGMFAITGEVFGLTYEPVGGVQTWHPDVSVHRILDTATGRHLATFYADLFPREGKFGHAAAFDLVAPHATAEGYVTPVTAIVANFTKPTADSPSLLKHDEVLTLFHEFGHVLHNSLGHTRLARFAGFNTEWDFVEAPSQIMEHWCWTPSVLQRFARHHETGEPIPAGLVGQLAEARDLHIGLFMLRQISFGLLDMAFHGPGKDKDLHEIARVTSEIAGFPFHEGTFYPASFGHLFGYDAGYYGYLWSMVYGDDMFSRFEEQGVLDPGVGMAYRRAILEQGGSRDAADLLRDFLGREPNQEAFLRKLGIDRS
ncbi:MAG: Zn-dependent oligopeptidase [Actinobacteria bacterium]|nr:Zn-dependent oligopeptidase [Actinomycetota bacterium]